MSAVSSTDKGGLRHVSEIGRIARHEGGDLGDRLHQRDGARRQLANRADHLGMTGMADQHDLTPALVVDLGLAVDLGHQRTGGVEREEVALLGLLGDRLRHAMGGEDHRRVGLGDLVELLDEDRLGLEALDHVAVVNDLVADVDRSAVAVERPLDRVDGARRGAEAARGAQQHLERGFWPVVWASEADIRTSVRHSRSANRHGPMCGRCQAMGRAAGTGPNMAPARSARATHCSAHRARPSPAAVAIDDRRQRAAGGDEARRHVAVGSG